MRYARFLLLGLLLAAVAVWATAPGSGSAEPGGALGSDDPSVVGATVSAGGIHSCGVRTDGTLACWG